MSQFFAIKLPIGTQTKKPMPSFSRWMGKDPPQTFVQRFAGHIPPVKESSKSYFRKNPFPGWLRDKETGLKAALLSVGAISWLSPNLVEVEGGIYCGGLCGASGAYHLERQSGKWVVRDFEVRAIS